MRLNCAWLHFIKIIFSGRITTQNNSFSVLVLRSLQTTSENTLKTYQIASGIDLGETVIVSPKKIGPHHTHAHTHTIYTLSPILFLALSSELIFSTLSSSSQHSSDICSGCVIVDSVDGAMLGRSICTSIDGDGAAIGDDDRLDDDILLLVLNLDG